jgi:CO/xanthine dehydrogenase FAD-binding subunit
LSLLFKPKSYLVPKDEGQLAKILKEHGEKARIIAGGTGIYEIAHRGLLSDIEALVDIRNLDFTYVRHESASLRIGAATTMTTLFHSQELKKEKKFQAIIDALSAIQPLQVKNVATIAGAICTALPFFDLPVALLSLNARVKTGPEEKTKTLSDFMRGYFAINLEPSEFVREIEIPLDDQENGASAFQKFAITHDDWALINCGVSLSLDKEKERVASSTIVFGGGVGERPVRASNVEKSLEGMKIKEDESKFKEIFEREIPKDLEPISDIRSSAEYRMRLAKVVGRRTFLQAVNRV